MVAASFIGPTMPGRTVFQGAAGPGGSGRGPNANSTLRNGGSPSKSRAHQQEDGGDVPKLIKVTQLHAVWPHQQNIGAGLANLGNTCYMNSCLQCLAYLPPLGGACVRGLLHGCRHCPRQAQQAPCAACLVQRQLHELLASGKTAGGGAGQAALRPTALQQQLQLFSKAFVRGRQEDAHEYLHALLDAVERDTKQAYAEWELHKGQRTLVEDLFNGRSQSQVRCLSCGHCSNTYETFCTLSLDLHSCGSLEDSLRQFARPERLDGANSYKCDKCKQLVPARKQLTVHEEPNVLVVHLKRFDALSALGTAKITRHIAFPLNLNLSQYSSSAAAAAAGDAAGAAASGTSGGTSHEEYYLTGVLVHQGATVHSGHYFAFVKDGWNQWHCVNDSTVYAVTPQQVLQQNAYMLFYARRTLAPPPAPPPQQPQEQQQAGADGEGGRGVKKPRMSRMSAAPIGPALPPDLAASRAAAASAGAAAGPQPVEAGSRAANGRWPNGTTGVPGSSNLSAAAAAASRPLARVVLKPKAAEPAAAAAAPAAVAASAAPGPAATATLLAPRGARLGSAGSRPAAAEAQAAAGAAAGEAVVTGHKRGYQERLQEQFAAAVREDADTQRGFDAIRTQVEATIRSNHKAYLQVLRDRASFGKMKRIPLDQLLQDPGARSKRTGNFPKPVIAAARDAMRGLMDDLMQRMLQRQQ